MKCSNLRRQSGASVYWEISAWNAILLHQTTQLMAGVIASAHRQTPENRDQRQSARSRRRSVGATTRWRAAHPFTHHYRLLDAGSPPITDRQHVTAPLYTSKKIIDTQIPNWPRAASIDHRRRWLWQKWACHHTIIQQAREKTCCVYVAPGTNPFQRSNRD